MRPPIEFAAGVYSARNRGDSMPRYSNCGALFVMLGLILWASRQLSGRLRANMHDRRPALSIRKCRIMR